MNQLLDRDASYSADLSLERGDTAYSNQHKLRIVHVVSSMRVGGMEQLVVRFTESQRNMGHDARVVALQGGPLLNTARESGLPVQVLGGKRTLLRVIRGAAALARLRPDIIHAHNPTSLHYAVLGKLVSRARVVMTDHAQTKGIQRVASVREQRLTDAVVAVSNDTAMKASVRGRAIPLSVIHNGIDLTPVNTDRNAVRNRLGLPDGVVGIIVASMEKVKRHKDLLLALALLRDQELPVTMLIVGDGPERKHLEEMTHDLKLGDEQIRFLGIRSDVTDLLGAADFFVLPSEMEGLPVSMLEAMKQSLPVIATPVGGVPELITHNLSGLLTPVSDPEALAQTISRVVRDPQLRALLGEAGYQRVNADFDFMKMMVRYIELYYRVQKAGRAG